jgi:hypothetical protein
MAHSGSINRKLDEGAGEGPEDTTSHRMNTNGMLRLAPPEHGHTTITITKTITDRNTRACLAQSSSIRQEHLRPQNNYKFSKEYVLYLGDDAFWGVEIDSTTKSKPSMASIQRSTHLKTPMSGFISSL